MEASDSERTASKLRNSEDNPHITVNLSVKNEDNDKDNDKDKDRDKDRDKERDVIIEEIKARHEAESRIRTSENDLEVFSPQNDSDEVLPILIDDNVINDPSGGPQSKRIVYSENGKVSQPVSSQGSEVDASDVYWNELRNDFGRTLRLMEKRTFQRWHKGAHERTWSSFSAATFCLFSSVLNLTVYQSACGISIADTTGTGENKLMPMTTIAFLSSILYTLVLFVFESPSVVRYSVWISIIFITIDAMYLVFGVLADSSSGKFSLTDLLNTFSNYNNRQNNNINNNYNINNNINNNSFFEDQLRIIPTAVNLSSNIISLSSRQLQSDPGGESSTLSNNKDTFLWEDCNSSHNQYFIWHWGIITFYALQLLVFLVDIYHVHIVGRLGLYYIEQSSIFLQTWHFTKTEKIFIYVPVLRRDALANTDTLSATEIKPLLREIEKNANRRLSSSSMGQQQSQLRLEFLKTRKYASQNSLLLGRGTGSSSSQGAAATDEPRIKVVEGMHCEVIQERLFWCLLRLCLSAVCLSGWFSWCVSPPTKRHCTSVSFTGEVTGKCIPQGFGYWRSDALNGECLVGYWQNGEPYGPFKSREVGTGSGFMCIKIGLASYSQADNRLRIACTNVECSVSGKFYRGYPSVQISDAPADEFASLSLFQTAKSKFNQFVSEGRNMVMRGQTAASKSRREDVSPKVPRPSSQKGPLRFVEDDEDGSSRHEISITHSPRPTTLNNYRLSAHPRVVSSTGLMIPTTPKSPSVSSPRSNAPRFGATPIQSSIIISAERQNINRSPKADDRGRLTPSLSRPNEEKEVSSVVVHLGSQNKNDLNDKRDGEDQLEQKITSERKKRVRMPTWIATENKVAVDKNGSELKPEDKIMSLKSIKAKEKRNLVAALRESLAGWFRRNKMGANWIVKNRLDGAWCLIQLDPHTPNFGIQPRSEMTITVDRDRGLCITGFVPITELVYENAQTFAQSPFFLEDDSTKQLNPLDVVSDFQPAMSPSVQIERTPSLSINAKPLVHLGLTSDYDTDNTADDTSRDNINNTLSVEVKVIRRPVMGVPVLDKTDRNVMTIEHDSSSPVQQAHEQADFGVNVFAYELEASGWLSMDTIGMPEVLVYIHGFNNSQYESCQVLGQMAAFGNYPNHIKLFLFSWPSGSFVGDFFNARGVAEALDTHRALFELFVVLRDNGVRQIHILCHSMGARLFLKAFRRIAKTGNLFALVESPKMETGYQVQTVNGVKAATSALEGKLQLLSTTFLNPEYFSDEFVNEDFPILRNYCAHISIYADRNDKALWWSETLSGRPALGRAVFGLIAQRFEEPNLEYLPETDQSKNLIRRRRPPQEGMNQADLDNTPRLQFLDTMSFFHLDETSKTFEGPEARMRDSSRKCFGLSKRKRINRKPLSTVEWLDLDIIDTTFMDQNIHSLRHSFWNINREIVEDIRELLVTRKRSRLRSGRLDRRDGNVWVFRVAPSFLTSIFDV